jgi:hypothetical protein
MEDTPLAESQEPEPTPVARGFRVPYGLDPAGALVAPDAATRSVPYVCPGCADRLTYRAGPIVSAHFAHRGGTGCTPESVLHAGTKLRVAAAVRAWLEGTGPRPIVRRECHFCGWVRDDPVKDGVVAVSVEHRLRAGGRDVVADLALLNDQGAARLLIEILVSHAVDREKVAAFEAAKLPWIELDAEQVETEAVVWRPSASGNVSGLNCPDCAARKQAHDDAIAAIAASQGSPPTVPGYMTSAYTCYRCRRPTLLYLWLGMFDYYVPPPPVPSTVQRRYSGEVRRRYWANTCGHCHAMIGNFYVRDGLTSEEFGFSGAGGEGSY